MSFSVNTNAGALVALQNLATTQSQLTTTQNRINTGLKVASAKDNAAIFGIAQNQRATSQSLNSVISSLQRGQSTVDVALSAGSSVSDLLNQMKEKALAAVDVTLDTTSRAALNDEFVSLRNQITTVTSNAVFNGANLINGGTTQLQALANESGSQVISVAHQSLALGGVNVTVASTASISTTAAASIQIAALNTSIANVSSALGKLGTGSKALASHQTFITNLQNTIDVGVGNLVDADLAKESANLQALQTKQQLGIQALSIANQSSSILLDRRDGKQGHGLRCHPRSHLRPEARPATRRYGDVGKSGRSKPGSGGYATGHRRGQSHQFLRLQDRQSADGRGDPAVAKGTGPAAARATRLRSRRHGPREGLILEDAAERERAAKVLIPPRAPGGGNRRWR
jgi:flagellin